MNATVQWDKGYPMGHYKYAFGEYKKTFSKEHDKGACTPQEMAYWQVVFFKKYNGKF